MIKINFATRKRSAAAAPGEKGKAGGLGKLDLGSLAELPLKKFALAAGACALGYWLLEDFKQTELDALAPVVQKLTAEQTRLNAELAKTKGFEAVKAQLEQDEFVIRTKIETIEKLVSDRGDTHKMMMNLSETLPAEVWLKDLVIRGGEVVFKGSSVGYNPISDFMKRLNESAYLSDLALLSTTQRADRRGTEIADFELTARRRSSN